MTLLDLRFKKKFSVSVFCGSRPGKNPAYRKVTAETGKLLAENDMRLVFGGGGTGLMGVLARAALDNGGEVYGVSEYVVATFEEPLKEILSRIAPDIQKRKREFIDHSDAFIILPGSFGTIDELLDVILGKYIVDRHQRYAKHKKYKEDRPIIIVNTNGYYDLFVKLVRHVIAEGFSLKDDLKLFKVVKTPKEAISLVKAWRDGK